MVFCFGENNVLILLTCFSLAPKEGGELRGGELLQMALQTAQCQESKVFPNEILTSAGY